MSYPKKLQLLLATSSRDKVREISSSLSGLRIEFHSFSTGKEPPKPRETGSNFQQNARLKAQYYYRLTRIPSLADDSGLSVDALDGAPGLFSSRLAPTDDLRIQKILKLMKPFPNPSERIAHFSCSLCLCLPDQLIEVNAQVDGRISKEPKGDSGFGYDSIFYYPPLGKTFGQMNLEEKNSVSHRARALKKLKEKTIGLLNY